MLKIQNMIRNECPKIQNLGFIRKETLNMCYKAVHIPATGAQNVKAVSSFLAVHTMAVTEQPGYADLAFKLISCHF